MKQPLGSIIRHGRTMATLIDLPGNASRSLHPRNLAVPLMITSTGTVSALNPLYLKYDTRNKTFQITNPLIHL